ncbi:NHL repeat-containing protein 2 [Nymphon striatum]|nr:NHL repeat-containing protein 2 [Nymphon striatum]
MLESEFKDTLRFVNEDNGTLLVFLSSLTVDRTSGQRLPDYEANCPCPSERVQRITISFNQDVVYVVTNGLEKTPKHVLLPYAIKSLTGNVELIHTLNRFGYGISYSKLEELDTALCLQKLSQVENEFQLEEELSEVVDKHQKKSLIEEYLRKRDLSKEPLVDSLFSETKQSHTIFLEMGEQTVQVMMDNSESPREPREAAVRKPSPNVMTPKTRMKIGAWNVRTLASTGQLANAIKMKMEVDWSYPQKRKQRRCKNSLEMDTTRKKEQRKTKNHLEKNGRKGKEGFGIHHMREGKNTCKPKRKVARLSEWKRFYLETRNRCNGNGFEWLNVDKIPTLNNVLGRIVVLDFFTYCCINCMHVIPILHDLEKTYKASGNLIVLGVHSAKFKNEKIVSNILNALSRYGITHPVVNDPQASLWNKFGIQCWPTLVIIGPFGNVLFHLMGEGNKEKLFEYCQLCVDYYDSKGKLGKVDPNPIRYNSSFGKTLLRFPSKVSVSPNGKLMAISGHHQIVIVNKASRIIECVVGGRGKGNKDGTFSDAEFNSPQGVAWETDDTLYVADTQNHTIRKISLAQNDVSTVAGTGHQVIDYIGGEIGTNQGISSPWDLSFSLNITNVLFIAMAGTHQIWTLFLEKTKWIDSVEYEKWTCKAFAGSGIEGNRNNHYPKNATFAQPSGLCASDSSSSCLFVADSESSSIRAISLNKGAVTAVVGGDRDPNNLFSYGDIDGTGLNAKLQHPLGVAWNEHDSKLYVADSYNHKIKVVNVETKICQTLDSNVKLEEPGGLCVAENGKALLVADTNNHRLIRIDLVTLEACPISISETKTDSVPDPCKRNHLTKSCDTLKVNQGDMLNLTLKILDDCHVKMNTEAPHFWSIKKSGSVEMKSDNGFQGMLTGSITEIVLTDLHNSGTLDVSACVYACSEDNGNCIMKEFEHKIEISSINGTKMENDNDIQNITVTWNLHNNS